MSIGHDEYLSMAIGLAQRSTLPMHKTGCIIVDHNDEVYSNGWSHMSSKGLSAYYSYHAEFHALTRFPRHKKHNGRWIKVYVATVSGRRRNRVTLAKPCIECAKNLLSMGLSTVYYTVDGTTKDFSFELLNLYEEDIKEPNFKRYRAPGEDENGL